MAIVGTWWQTMGISEGSLHRRTPPISSKTSSTGKWVWLGGLAVAFFEELELDPTWVWHDELWHGITLYHLVMTNSSPWKDPPMLLSSVNHLFRLGPWRSTMANCECHNQRVTQLWGCHPSDIPQFLPPVDFSRCFAITLVVSRDGVET